MLVPSLLHQIVWLFVLAIPVACIAWTVTHEEIFRELRQYCSRQSGCASSLLTRKFLYIFTCEYCFSHYVVIVTLLLTQYRLLYPDWRGYLIGGFSLVFVSNLYMGVFGQVKLGVKKDRAEIRQIETEVRQQEVREQVGEDPEHRSSEERPAA